MTKEYFPNIKRVENCTPENPMPLGTMEGNGVIWFHHFEPHGVHLRPDGTLTRKCEWCGTEIETKRGSRINLKDPKQREEMRAKAAEMRAKGLKPYDFKKVIQ